MMLRPRQSLLVERTLSALGAHGNTLAVAPTGCHAPGTLILMQDGTQKPVEAIIPGDRLMGPDSRPRRVHECHRGHDEMFEIRPLKGEPFVVNIDHMLTLVRTPDGKSPRGAEVIDISLRQYLEASATFRHLHKLFRVAVDFPARDAPSMDAYLLGVLIGDGALMHGINVTTPDVEIVEVLYEQAAAFGLRVPVDQLPGNLANTYHLVGARGVSNPIIEALRQLGLHGHGAAEKFLPDAYKLGSRETRLAVLAGLLDTDGHLSRGASFEYCSRSLRLAQDVAFVARSLGFLATLRRKVVMGSDYWRVHISGDCSCIPLRILRKQSLPRRQIKDVLRTGFTAHRLGTGEYFGFSLDGDHRYLLADFTVTHNSGKTSSVFDANEKSWRGQATFAMVQTLSRQAHLDQMPSLDLLVIDEAHHASSPTYRAVIEAVLARNPRAGICGLTATPNRGDGKGLREVFSNVADQITLGETIAAGHLVSPRTFVIDVGVQDALQKVRKTAIDFDMDEVASILDKRLITEAVIKHWKEKAETRQSIIFCSTVAHATNVRDAFVAAGINAVLIYGELSDGERKARLAQYESGNAQVVVNVAVLTEGYDYTPTSCVVLLRPSSYKSTFIQMVGRGLRTVDPAEFPGVAKTDCIVLDFGTASLMHGSLEQEVNLDGHLHDGEAPIKDCPDCCAIVPLACMECPLCGYAWERQPQDCGVLADFVMSEIDLLKRSNFRWCDLFGSDDALMATGFNAWGGIFFLNGRWHAVGGAKDVQPHLLAVGERTICMAKADDWLNDHETADSAHKTRRWLNEPPTQKQLQYLPQAMRADFGMTRYQASTLLSFHFNKSSIQRLVMAANDAYREAA